MEQSLKNRILNYLNDPTVWPADPELEDERRDLVRKMESEVCYVDVNTHTLCVEDLDKADSAILREKLGKKEGEAYTIEDCERVSEALADCICEDFGEDLRNAIEYGL